MVDFPTIPEAEFSPAWHQYHVLLRQRLEERLDALEGVESDFPGILIQGSRAVYSTQTITLIDTVTQVVEKEFACLKSDSRVIVRGAMPSHSIVNGDAEGIVLWLYVDGANSGETPVTSQYKNNGDPSMPFSFEYSPGDTEQHIYSMHVQGPGATTGYTNLYPQQPYMQLEEWATS